VKTSPSVETRPFHELCADHGLTVTHQRQVLYQVMQTMPGHPSPEEVYARVKKRIPAISLATVYKNIHLFVERGVLKEVSMHHGSLRVELNSHPHHHMVCLHCKAITDIEEKDLGVLPTLQRLPGGFQVERYAIDVIGICAACQKVKRS
jgi:Fur family transcriptional regulator, peroxide stress response regulator